MEELYKRCKKLNDRRVDKRNPGLTTNRTSSLIARNEERLSSEKPLEEEEQWAGICFGGFNLISPQ